jgi:thiosulfate/3-mercaptopyruvate sulfurtransferase
VRIGIVVATVVELTVGSGFGSTVRSLPPPAASVALAGGAVDPAGQTRAENPWRADQVVEPADLAKALAGGGEKPVVLDVGFPLLYAGGHIPGARYLGPASTASGLQALREAAEKLPRDGDIVLYCGCCPMNRCPNIRPAFRLMEQLGFTNANVLDIPVNFPHDWTSQGYPIDKGGPPRSAQSS